MTNTEKRVEEFADQMIAWEMMTPPEEKAIQRPKMVLDYFKISIHQAIAEERERVVREISKIRIEMDSRKTFNCVKKTDVHGFCCDAHLGEADANTKWGQALSCLDINPK